MKKFLLVTGLPGSGKTFVMNHLFGSQEYMDISQYRIIKRNAMVYNGMNEFLSDMLIEFKVNNSKKEYNSVSTKIKRLQKKTILLIDEMDSLIKSFGNEFFEFVDLTRTTSENFLIIGITNMTELILTLSEKSRSYLRDTKHLIFRPYTYDEIEVIVKEKVDSICSHYSIEELFEPNAFKFTLAKVFNIKGGDIRAVFDVLQKIIKRKLKKSNEFMQISLKDVREVTCEYDKFLLLKDLANSFSLQQKIMLAAIAKVKSNFPDCDSYLSQDIFNAFQYLGEFLNIDFMESSEKKEILHMLQQYNIVEFTKINPKKKLIGSMVKVNLSLEELNNLLQDSFFCKFYEENDKK